MERVRHHGRETAYRTAGDGTRPPLCCVHGSGGTHGLWAAQLARLDVDRPVVALDLSGRGESSDIRDGVDPFEAYVEDVLAVARETGADVLVGASLGGALVLRIMLARDLTVSAAVLAGTAARLRDEGIRSAVDDFAATVELLLEPGYLFADPTDRLAAASRASLAAVGEHVVRRDFLAGEGFDVRDRLDEIRAPVLALTGDRDRMTPPADARELAAGIRGGEWTTVPRAAHLSMVERPAAFDERVARFLRGVA